MSDGRTVTRAAIATLLAVVLAVQGCAVVTRRVAVTPPEDRSEKRVVDDKNECEAEAGRISSYSPTGIVGFWARVLVGYTIVAVAVGLMVAFVIATWGIALLYFASAQRAPGETRRGGSFDSWIGSEPRLEEFLAAYGNCLKARGYQVSESQP